MRVSGDRAWRDTRGATRLRRLVDGVEWGSCTRAGVGGRRKRGNRAMVLNLLLLGLVWLAGLTAVHCVIPGPLRRCSQAVRVAALATARLQREHHGGSATGPHRIEMAQRTYRSATLVDVP